MIYGNKKMEGFWTGEGMIRFVIAPPLGFFININGRTKK